MARRKSKTQHDLEMRLINAAMELAARRRWRDIRIADIAAEAELPITDALAQGLSKTAILNAFGRHINRAVLDGLRADPEIGDSPKDRLFDLLMRRFDAMVEYRSGLAGISADLGFDPFAALSRLCGIKDAMGLTLEAAGISATGPCGVLQRHGLSAIYVYCLSVWFRDETDDMSITMASVDRALTFAEKIISRLPNQSPLETGANASATY